MVEIIRTMAGTMNGLALQQAIGNLDPYRSRGKGCGTRHKQAVKHPWRNAGNKYARVFNGAQEVARRQRQMARNVANHSGVF